ncbi:MAG: polysaccharide deacetylase family protein [Cyclobacteriaceae bacterium]
MIRPIFLLLFLFSFSTRAQEIAITFDDAPTPDGPLLRGEERTTMIIDHLKKHHVKEAAFFVVTGSIHQRNIQRLKKYVDAGHLSGNHSNTHRRIDLLGTGNYIRDVERADSMLNLYSSYMKWFRFPFLDEGRTISARDSIRMALRDIGLKNGYVTVDNYDWYINHLVKVAKEGNKKINEDNLRKVYIDHISFRIGNGIAPKDVAL